MKPRLDGTGLEFVLFFVVAFVAVMALTFAIVLTGAVLWCS